MSVLCCLVESWPLLQKVWSSGKKKHMTFWKRLWHNAPNSCSPRRLRRKEVDLIPTDIYHLRAGHLLWASHQVSFYDQWTVKDASRLWVTLSWQRCPKYLEWDASLSLRWPLKKPRWLFWTTDIHIWWLHRKNSALTSKLSTDLSSFSSHYRTS